MYENDYLLEVFFEKERWEEGLLIATDKGISKKEIRELTTVEKRKELLHALVTGRYAIAPPHQAEIPKDDGTMRIVYVNEGIDRIFLSIANNMLFELMPEMVHPACKSYQAGIGCGKIVQQITYKIDKANGRIIGWKADFTKYFDSVPIEFIDAMFDLVEMKYGKSVIIDVLREYYHSNWCFTVEMELIEHYQSLKQGCAVASWLADVIMYTLDAKLSELNGFYVRYSDDTLFVGEDYEKAMEIMADHMRSMGMTLNPKKVEYISSKNWFKFLGFMIKGDRITLSKKRISNICKEIKKRTIKCRDITSSKALRNIMEYFYEGEYALATTVLPIINSESDIQIMNNYAMDCIKACNTSRKKVEGIGFEPHEDGCLVRKNVGKPKQDLIGYISLNRAREALVGIHKSLYNSLVAQPIGFGRGYKLIPGEGNTVYESLMIAVDSGYHFAIDFKRQNIRVGENYLMKHGKTMIPLGVEPMDIDSMLDQIEYLYEQYKYSTPSERSKRKRRTYFRALPESELEMSDLVTGMPREIAQAELEGFVALQIANGNLKWSDLSDDDRWYWHGAEDGLIIFKDWFGKE